MTLVHLGGGERGPGLSSAVGKADDEREREREGEAGGGTRDGRGTSEWAGEGGIGGGEQAGGGGGGGGHGERASAGEGERRQARASGARRERATAGESRRGRARSRTRSVRVEKALFAAAEAAETTAYPDERGATRRWRVRWPCGRRLRAATPHVEIEAGRRLCQGGGSGAVSEKNAFRALGGTSARDGATRVLPRQAKAGERRGERTGRSSFADQHRSAAFSSRKKGAQRDSGASKHGSA